MAPGIRLLEPAIRYALAAATAVTPEFLSRPTPCGGWDLRMLLRHASESLAAICEGIDAGCIELFPSGEDADVASEPAEAFRDRADRLLGACTSPGRQHEAIHTADGLRVPVTLFALSGVLTYAPGVQVWADQWMTAPLAARRGIHGRLARLACGKEGAKCRGQTAWLSAVA